MLIIDNNSCHYDNNSFDYEHVVDKPIIYIYPEQTTEVSITLGRPENLTATYPKYDNGWQVQASPNGDLIDLKTNKKLYSLYWEGKNSHYKMSDEGFVVSGDQVADFLDEKLTILGLNEYEREEFIIYWLPKLQDNKYNYVRFATDAEIEENMPLEVSPTPDTVIRVMMIAKPLTEQIQIKEQSLIPKSRSGYTVVEWGGSIL